MRKIQAKGTLAQMLSGMDQQELHRTENKMRIAMKIAEALRSKGLTQKQFAQMMGCSAPEVSDILSGTRNLTLDKLSDIENALDIRLVDSSMLVAAN